MTITTERPTIAVVIPNRNDATYLRACLDSVLKQRVRANQIIVVDDASTDRSLDVIHEKLQDLHGVEVVANPVCLGTMAALNVGLERVTSDYVLFLSSNDYLTADILERAKSSIGNTAAPGIWSAMVWVAREDGRRRFVYPSPVVALRGTFLSSEQCTRLAKSPGNWFTGTTTMYHRETLQRIGGFDADYGGLADLLAATTVASIKGAYFLPEPLGVVRKHARGYLWRTLTNLPSLENILEKVQRVGPTLSPALFSQKFCERTKHRLHFASLRAINDQKWVGIPDLWHGRRYAALRVISGAIGERRRTQLIIAFLLLRPLDVPSAIWNRGLLTLWVMWCTYVY